MSKTPEILLTCDLCGQGNLTPRGLKPHQQSKHCRDARKKPEPAKGVKPLTLGDLEVLPPIKRASKGQIMPLAEIEDHIRALDAKIEDRTRGYHNEVIYDIVGKGLMLLKGRALHLAQASTQFQAGGKKALKSGVETVATPSGKQLAKIEEKGEGGFLGWLEEKFPEQSSRTARNYMNAARNAGLTADHGPEDVEALRVAMALHEKKPTDLYRLADAVKDEPTRDEPAPAPNMVKDALRDLFATCDTAIVLRDNMEPEDYEAAHVRLHSTLEKLTGAKWVMLDEAPSIDGAQHGDLHAGKGAKSRAKRDGAAGGGGRRNKGGKQK